MADCLTHATRSPLGETAGEFPSPSLRGADPSSLTSHTSSAGPDGFIDGLAVPPRTYTMAFASGVQRMSVISWPSSPVHCVIARERYCGASATIMLRTPLTFETHATFPPAGALVSDEGNGALSTWSSVNGACWAKAQLASRTRAMRIEPL